MANNALTILKILQESQRILENNLTFTKFVDRQYSDEFGRTGAKIGATVNLRRPIRTTVSTGAALQVQDYVETYVPVVLTNQDHVDLAFTSLELTLQIDRFSERVIKPAMASLANIVDFNGLGQYVNVANFGGTPGTPPASAFPFLEGGAVLDSLATPRDNQRSAVLDPFTQAYLVDGLKGLFQKSDNIAMQYEEGTMGTGLGFKFSMDQNVRKHVPGARGGVPITTGAQGGTVPVGALGQPGSDATRTFPLLTGGWTAAVAVRANAGDVFTLPGVFSVNPQSRVTTGRLQTFTVTANASSDVAGVATLNVYPYPIFSGQFQNVTSASGDIPASSPLTFVSGTFAAGASYAQNLLFHKDAFTLATADLIMPEGVDMSARNNYKGISMRIVRQYRIGTDDLPCRTDILYGWKTIYPELAYRLSA
jgi:hypothetical protein